MLFAKNPKKEMMKRIIRASEDEAIKSRIFADFYRDLIALEEMGDQQKNQYEMKIKAAEEGAEFNEKIVRYLKPLL